MIQTKLEHVKKVYNHVKSNRNKSEYSKRRCDYAEYYKKCKVKNIVLYEAFAARGMLCSPYALFKEFMNRSDIRFTIWKIMNILLINIRMFPMFVL